VADSGAQFKVLQKTLSFLRPGEVRERRRGGRDGYREEG